MVVIGLALDFWCLFYREQVGDIDGEQHMAKTGPLWYSSGQLFLFRKSSFNINNVYFLSFFLQR